MAKPVRTLGTSANSASLQGDTGWQAEWGDVVLFLLQVLSPHAHSSPKHIHDLVPAPQLLQLLKTTTGHDFLHTRDFSFVWPLGVLILSTARSGCSVNMELRVTSSSARPVGCTSTFCSAGNSPKAHRILSLFIFSLFISFFPPPTLVLAVTENNGFVGGFKTSERERTSTAVHFVVRQGTVLKKWKSRSGAAAAAVAHPKQ